MYHPGRVLKIFSAKDREVKGDATTQALVEMWDENLFTFAVDAKIAADVKEGDIVLVDYTSVSQSSHMPRHVIVKILRGKTADAIWKEYKKYDDKKKRALAKQAAQAASQITQQPEYFG
ncbi:MAG: hypothetical protein HYW26_00965 [Candidatus Aenigmarchaeota archaeon]|nr:hypothetical protein [Candidatus Aenigmarchaeota archaeon]